MRHLTLTCEWLEMPKNTATIGGGDFVDRIPISSRSIASIGYAEATFVLEVVFLNGTIYHYYGIP